MFMRLDHLSQLAFVQLLDDEVSTSVAAELLSGSIPHTVAIHGLGLFDGVDEDSQSPHVIVRFCTLLTGRQSVHDDACFASPYERGSCPDPNGRAAREQDLLKS